METVTRQNREDKKENEGCEYRMSVFTIGGDYVAIALKQEDLEDSINGLQQE